MTVHASVTGTPGRVIVANVRNKVMDRMTVNVSVTSKPTRARIVYVESRSRAKKSTACASYFKAAMLKASFRLNILLSLELSYRAIDKKE